MRLIRSKGVGVYFVTQNPLDIPDTVLAQLGNRVQHALRAFTPRDQKAVKAAADTFRPNPKVDVAREITELKVGEALVSLLMPDGAPSPVERTLIKPPCSRAGPLDAKERAIIKSISPVEGKYDTVVDRESAEELLAAKAEQAQAAAIEAKAQAEADKQAAIAAKEAAKVKAAEERERLRLEKAAAREAAKPSMTEKMVQSAARSAATSIGRQVAGKLGGQLMRGILGSLFK